MDFQKGIVCNLTGEHATFTNECRDFAIDEKEVALQEQAEETQVINKQQPKEIINRLDPSMVERLKETQDYLYAILGGLAAALLGAVLWATVTVITEYQIGFMAIGVGLMVGFSVRWFGAGVDMAFGIIGAFFALLGCFLGNLFSQIWFIADYQSLSFFDAFRLLDFATMITIVTETFGMMDILFYGFAIAEGYKFAFRKLTVDEINRLRNSPEYTPYPANHKLRLPLVITAFILLSVTYFSLSGSVSGEQVYYYDNGEVMSEGNMKDGVVDGMWKYYDEQGNLSLEGTYNVGLEEGEWIWYLNNSVSRVGHYSKGIAHGTWINYYENGNKRDSGRYENGRMSGYWVTKYQNGNIASEGDMERDYQANEWKTYYENGQLSSFTQFKNKALSGKCKYWYASGQLAREVEYLDKGKMKIISNWDLGGNSLVKDGNGICHTYYDNGQIAQEGAVVNGDQHGEWITYYENGNLMLAGTYDQDDILVVNTYKDEIGNSVINDGNGLVKNLPLDDNTYEEGELVDGYREGLWHTYSTNSGALVAETNYKKGKIHGSYNTYFESGVLQVEGYFDNDNRNGLWSWYYENGQLETSATYINNDKDGVQEFYSELGMLVRQENYKNGKLLL